MLIRTRHRALVFLLAASMLVATAGIASAEDTDPTEDDVPASTEIAADDAASAEEPTVSDESDQFSEESDADADTGKKLQYQTLYRLDSRYMGDSDASKADIMAGEIEVNGSYGDKVDFAVQVPLATGMEGRGKDMHFGNAYAVIKGKIKQPTVKIGQFVIPFGNLADYETHTRIFQTLYPNSLGVRIDPGVEVEGYLGDAEYLVAVTNGNGPWRKDIDGNKVVTARVSKRFQIGDDDLKVGVSALKGRLPVFSLMDDPLMDGKDAKLVDVRRSHAVSQNDPSGFADKTRYGVDFEYYKGIDLIRGEVVFGSDDGRSVNGQWLQYEHPLNYKTSLIGMVERWQQSTGSFIGWGVGVEHKLNDNRTVRVAYQNRRIKESLHDPVMGDTMPMRMNMPMLTLQYLVEF